MAGETSRRARESRAEAREGNTQIRSSRERTTATPPPPPPPPLPLPFRPFLPRTTTTSPRAREVPVRKGPDPELRPDPAGARGSALAIGAARDMRTNQSSLADARSKVWRSAASAPTSLSMCVTLATAADSSRYRNRAASFSTTKYADSARVPSLITPARGRHAGARAAGWRMAEDDYLTHLTRASSSTTTRTRARTSVSSPPRSTGARSEPPRTRRRRATPHPPTRRTRRSTPLLTRSSPRRFETAGRARAGSARDRWTPPRPSARSRSAPSSFPARSASSRSGTWPRPAPRAPPRASDSPRRTPAKPSNA